MGTEDPIPDCDGAGRRIEDIPSGGGDSSDDGGGEGEGAVYFEYRRVVRVSRMLRRRMERVG
jgi:hypothetical protein